MTRAILVLAHEMSANAQPTDVSLQRLEGAVAEFRANPDATFVTSGWGYRDDTDKTLADAMAEHAVRHHGIPDGKVIRSHKSRDTVGDAVFFARLVAAEDVTVVTSAFHRDRTEQIFRFVLPADTKLRVIGVGDPATEAQEANEARSLTAFRETFAGIDPGDIASIETRLLERHPLYNGKMNAKSYRQHD